MLITIGFWSSGGTAEARRIRVGGSSRGPWTVGRVQSGVGDGFAWGTGDGTC